MGNEDINNTLNSSRAIEAEIGDTEDQENAQTFGPKVSNKEL